MIQHCFINNTRGLMNNISNFKIPLRMYIYTLAAVGYLGYRLISWIVHKCQKSQTIDQISKENLKTFGKKEALRAIGELRGEAYRYDEKTQ